MVKEIKLIRKIKISAKIKTLTGLHIGGTDQGIDLGGLDKLIVRNPITNMPYIPGSSIKGKLRSLIELKDGTIQNKNSGGGVNYTATDKDESRAGMLFGTSSGKDTQRPSRIIVRDATLANVNELKDLELPYAEAKTEVTIDRITAKANPRTIERVPAGAEFEMNLILNIFKEDDVKLDDKGNVIDRKELLNPEAFQDEALKIVTEAMRLLQDDYIGGNGSRGYGHIKFEEVKILDGDKELTTNYWKN